MKTKKVKTKKVKTKKVKTKCEKKVSIIWLSGQHATCKMIGRCLPGVEHHQRHSARLHLTVTVLGAVVALQRSFAFQFRRVKSEKKF